ncbi:sugar fermentation stimulation protein [Lucifera butyrica]|uniref:Sugar fermentation stimulation protein homolog n=1 Tax=Lucifera butyrica TaxID=1351585 RepID=A0A498R338_9FIRM|nr:DNA/RNA nuclease SfsA [Lucifera butyrica]VBB07056.1 sugar fermentation stimulation protein [Lucifera butyrica]
MADVYYSGIVSAGFVRRCNRFVVECDLQGKRIQAHLPNPGRMWELLFPGRLLYLTPSAGAEKKTQYKVVGVERNGTPILLDTQLSNLVAAQLIRQNRIPAFSGWDVMKREVTFGDSRFDLLLGRGEERFIVEIKSCTLFGRTLAMFPDAPTERGRKHLRELAELTKAGYRTGVLFLVQWRHAQYFLPDYHTDLAFSRTLYELRRKIEVVPVAVEWLPGLILGKENRVLPVPWEIIGREAQDGGCYIFVLRLPVDSSLPVGTKGIMHFPRGYYLYVGSAKQNLTARLERHRRKRKKFHWHIDYLRQICEPHAAIPIRTTAPLEHEIAAAVSKIADWRIPGFGASDCDCNTHLFGMREDPVHSPAFIELLQYFRMDRLDDLRDKI